MSNPSFTQLTFRVRNDDGSETTATWRQTQGINDTILTDTNFRIRFRIDETASVAWTNITWNLRYSLNGGAYTAVSASTPIQFSASSNFADGDDCTTQLTGGTGTFVTNNNGMKETTGGAINSGTAGQLFETEWCVKIDSAQVSNNDTIGLRIYNGSSAIATYTATPTITVNEPVTISFSGSSAGVATASGALGISRNLAGTSDGLATATGTLNLARNLTGTASGIATASADLTLETVIAFSGSSAGAGNATGDIALTRNLSGASDGLAATQGSLDVTRNLTGASDGIATVSAALSITHNLSGISAGSTALSGELTNIAGVSDENLLSGESAGSADTTGILDVTRNLSGLSAGMASGDADLALDINLIGSVFGTSNAVGMLHSGAAITPPTYFVVSCGRSRINVTSGETEIGVTSGERRIDVG